MAIYLILCGLFCCLGGLFALWWWLSKEVARLQVVVNELTLHVVAHDEHLDVHDKCWIMQRNKMAALTNIEVDNVARFTRSRGNT
jgi:hypothetical protein